MAARGVFFGSGGIRVGTVHIAVITSSDIGGYQEMADKKIPWATSRAPS